MDVTQIYNMTLQAIGVQQPVSSPTEPTPGANAISTVYDQTLRELLRKYNWGFARYQAALSVLKAAQGTPENPTGTTLPIPPVPWAYEYAYPSDCAAPRAIVPIIAGLETTTVPIFSSGQSQPAYTQVSNIRYVVASDNDTATPANKIRVILSNWQDAILVYTRYITEPNLFDDQFVTALVGRLAAKVVFVLSGDKTLAKMAMDAGKQAEIEAEESDGQEGIQVQDTNPDWLGVRGWIDPTESDVFSGNGVTTDLI